MSASEGCPICLEQMSEGDEVYPILCPTKCGFNFCLRCAAQLVETSGHDYEVASDGNRHVKVKLQCPQCRGSLVHTIQDTILMRRAVIAQAYMTVPDQELSSSALRIKHEFVQHYATEVEHAQARLRKFQRDHDHGEIQQSINLQPSQEEEEKTFRDETLFGGMEYAMSEAEQVYVTQLMISGDVSQLAQAAQIVHGIFEISMQGTTPSTKTTNPPPRSRSAEIRRLALLDRFKKTHPLPARMPKYTVLTVFSPRSKPCLTFVDDEWDGSIADAFTRVHGPSSSSSRKNPGVDRILNLADSQHCSDPTSRVKIKSVRGQAGRVGLQRGDVVTHVNAEPWEGTAEELSSLIYRMYQEDPSQTFSIVVNAEPATAQALKLRGQACQLVLKDDV